jgi:hypothetical protein
MQLNLFIFFLMRRRISRSLWLGIPKASARLTSWISGATERGQVRLLTSGWDANMTAAAPPMPISGPAPTVDSVPLALGSVPCTQEHGPPIAQPLSNADTSRIT